MGRFIRGLVLLAIAGGVAFFILTMPRSAPLATQLPPRTANLANGETMFHAGGCASCHATPQQRDSTRLGGGLALATPFGTFHAPNISPDRAHGIGDWTEEVFANAMLRGIGRNDEHLYPAFPYTSYQRMVLDDVRDLFAFIKTLPAETTPSQPHDLKFPFTIRRGLGLWKLRYLDGKTFTPDPAKDARFNRGAYLVEGPGHCAECHSGRDAFGGIDPERRFAGGVDIDGKSWVPNITPHPDGIAKWSEKDIVNLLETGQTPDDDTVGSTMADVVKNTGKLSAEARMAMATYIKALPPRPGKAPPPPPKQ